jgi:5-hydroxyisourate hydrolase
MVRFFDNPSNRGAGDMDHSVERRDFLAGTLAVGALAATTGAAAAETLDPHRITLHVLDVYSGKPGANVRVDLSVLDGQTYRLLKTVNTTVSGRPEAPVVSGEDCKVGEYELMFHVADYYSGLGVKLPNPPFLNKVPVRFAVFELAAYHIPLLLTPWSYSTYRGS